MLLVIQCIVCCVIFTLIILPAQYKDPLCMIASYPPTVRKRVASLPKYKDVITEKEKKHIILVDDNADFLRSMKKVLEDKYSVSLAISAAQAMTIMGKRKPDLMILDYDMPICDGKMMLEMIRADENLKFVPVIFLTGYSDREHVKAVLDLKPSGYFLKPPAYDKLLEGIAELLEE